jgi:DNA-directed RNA polymerase subunit RPC12/RpoP
MKVINEGNGSWRPWWVGQRMKCQECGREVELEVEDDISANWTPALDGTAKIRCERCGSMVSIEQKFKVMGNLRFKNQMDRTD